MDALHHLDTVREGEQITAIEHARVYVAACRGDTAATDRDRSRLSTLDEIRTGRERSVARGVVVERPTRKPGAERIEHGRRDHMGFLDARHLRAELEP